MHPRIVGDVLSPLLGLIPVKDSSGQKVHVRYEKLHFVPVLKKNISSIHISLRDGLGELIRFRKGKVIETLHLRWRKLEHP